MLIDCDICRVRGAGCADCVVTVLLGTAGSVVDLDEAEEHAMGTLARSGLVPPLRLVPGDPSGPARAAPQDRSA